MISDTTPSGGGLSDRTFIRRALIVFLLVVIGAVLWTASHALVLLFGAILFAVVLRGLAGILRHWTRLPEGPSVVAVLLLLVTLLVGSGWLFGSQISAQFRQLADRLPTSVSELENQLRSTALGQEVLEQTGGLTGGGQEGKDGQEGAGGQEGTGRRDQPQAGSPQPQSQDKGPDSSILPDGLSSGLGWALRQMGTFAMALADAAAQIILVLFGAIFLAFQPGLYRAGVAKLVPRDQSGRVEKVLDRTGGALWLWAAGQMVEMVIIGLLTGIGLWLLGVPAPLALGLIAGLLEFIPFAGPILAAIPGILLALTVSPTLALWTALFYLVLQQLEGNLILPLIQRKAVDLPPVVAIFSLLIFGSLFGVIGVLFAVPLAVATLTIVQVLYVKETLHRDVHVEGT